jgi:hypothetical protein
VRVEEFTFEGDPLRLDYAYRRNGTRGFVQALPLGRDPGQAKVLAFTADAIRAKLAKTEFLAISEVEPRPQENARHRFVTGLLEQRDIPVVPLNGWPNGRNACGLRCSLPTATSRWPQRSKATAAPGHCAPLLCAAKPP